MTVDGKAWTLKASQVVKVVDGHDFVKLSAIDSGFVNVVVGGSCKLARNPSLAGCTGLKELVNLRNDQQMDDLKPVAPSLFDQPVVGPPKKQRRTKAQLQEMREHPVVVTVYLPPFGDYPGIDLKLLRPLHAHADLVVELDAAMLQHIIMYIRYRGFRFHGGQAGVQV